MAYPTPIEWTDATWNPVGGCSIHSPGCKFCYAQGLAGTRLSRHPLLLADGLLFASRTAAGAKHWIEGFA